MNSITHTDPARRHDFVVLFDVQDGNPNGDPDAGNQPRVDPETMQGIVTDVALKRKVRDYVDLAGEGNPRNKIYVQREKYLTETRKRVFQDNSKAKNPETADAQKWMCQEFYDIRMFGAVMGMKEHGAGQVRGPLQITFSRSIDRVQPADFTITRVALENRKEKRAQHSDDELAAPTHGTMGRKATVPYGLYRCYGFFNPHFAQKTGANSDDLAIFWEALLNMWDLDRSSSKGMMACKGLYIFSHESPLGNAPAHKLFEKIQVHLKDKESIPRQFDDYQIMVDETNLPEGVTINKLEG